MLIVSCKLKNKNTLTTETKMAVVIVITRPSAFVVISTNILEIIGTINKLKIKLSIFNALFKNKSANLYKRLKVYKKCKKIQII